MTSAEIEEAKQAMREQVWASLDAARAVRPPGASNRIPHFLGNDEAAMRLEDQPEWQSARVVKANPDKAQFPSRLSALRDGKLLYMAVPKLATRQPFYRLDPTALSAEMQAAVTGAGAAEHAELVTMDDMEPVDLVLCGTVAVSRSGTRVGKGAGYADIEFGLLTEAGLIGTDTTIATTVHDLQVLDTELPETEHDFRVDLIVTPTEVIRCRPEAQPRGLYWDHLDAAKISSIPVLADLCSLR